MRRPEPPRRRSSPPAQSATARNDGARTVRQGKGASRQAEAVPEVSGRAAMRAERRAGRAAQRSDRAEQRAPNHAGRSQISDRIAEQRAAKRHLRIRAVIASATAVAVVLALGWVVFASPWLRVQADQVQITGMSEEIRKREVNQIVAAAHGVPVARVDTAGIAEQIRGLAAVKDVQVNRAWPHGLRVMIDARVPVAVVDIGKKYALVDAEGVVIARLSKAPKKIPQVTVTLDDPKTADSLRAVLTVLSSLPERMRSQVVSAGARSPHQVQFTLNGGAEVIWGSADENALKVKVLQALRAQKGSNPSRYDLSAPRAPITKE